MNMNIFVSNLVLNSCSMFTITNFYGSVMSVFMWHYFITVIVMSIVVFLFFFVSFSTFVTNKIV